MELTDSYLVLCFSISRYNKVLYTSSVRPFQYHSIHTQCSIVLVWDVKKGNVNLAPFRSPILPEEQGGIHCKRDCGAKEDFSQLYAGKIPALCWEKPYFPNFSSLMLGKSLLYAGKIIV